MVAATLAPKTVGAHFRDHLLEARAAPALDDHQLSWQPSLDCAVSGVDHEREPGLTP
jgi:hypothetical protein